MNAGIYCPLRDRNCTRECRWWDSKHGRCSVMAISESLSRIAEELIRSRDQSDGTRADE